MPYRRKYKKPVRNYKRRVNRRTKRRTRSRVGPSKKLHFFSRYVDLGSINASGTLDSLDSYAFQLNDVPGISEFIRLFDQYKLKAVKITFIPQQTENISLSTVNNAWGSQRFFSVIDYNDVNLLGSIDEAREYSTCKWTKVLRSHSRYIPNPQVLSSDNTNAVYSWSPWLNTANTDVRYAGLKVAIENTFSTVSTSMLYNIEAKYYMVFRNVK